MIIRLRNFSQISFFLCACVTLSANHFAAPSCNFFSSLIVNLCVFLKKNWKKNRLSEQQLSIKDFHIHTRMHQTHKNRIAKPRQTKRIALSASAISAYVCASLLIHILPLFGQISFKIELPRHDNHRSFFYFRISFFPSRSLFVDLIICKQCFSLTLHIFVSHTERNASWLGSPSLKINK